MGHISRFLTVVTFVLLFSKTEASPPGVEVASNTYNVRVRFYCSDDPNNLHYHSAMKVANDCPAAYADTCNDQYDDDFYYKQQKSWCEGLGNTWCCEHVSCELNMPPPFPVVPYGCPQCQPIQRHQSCPCWNIKFTCHTCDGRTIDQHYTGCDLCEVIRRGRCDILGLATQYHGGARCCPTYCIACRPCCR